MSPKIEKIKPILKNMNLNELEELKNLLIANYFQKFEKRDLKFIENELKNANHNKTLINDIINGLKKASIYEN